MNEKIAHRIQKLMKINLKMEHPPELFVKFATESINLDNKITGLSDKEAIDVLIPKEEREQTSIGVMYHLLTTSDNLEQFSKMVRYIVGAGVDYWHIVLCNLNMILFEMWQHIHTGCKEQLVRLIREGIRHNVRQIENVIMNVFRSINGTGDWHSKNRILHMLMNYIREGEGWFTSVKVCPGLTASIIIVVSHMIVDTPQPFTKEDNFRQQLINFLHWTIKTRKHECVALGRDFLLVLTRLGRIPQFEEIWREIHQSPQHYGFSSVDELLSRPNGLSLYRLSVELQRKMDHMMFLGGKNLMLYYDWMFRKGDSKIQPMSRRFISLQARAISGQYNVVRNKIIGKLWKMDMDSIEVISTTLYEKIMQIDRVLRNQQVRGHQDTSFQSPEVHERSSIKLLLERLKQQINATSVLCDVCHLGPVANVEEQTAIQMVEQVLNLLDDVISPGSSHDGSATESD